MMRFKVIFSELAAKQFHNLGKDVQAQVAKRLDKAADNPRLFAKSLTGTRSLSIRAGNYRIIVDLDEKSTLIMVLDVGHRRRIYKNL